MSVTWKPAISTDAAWWNGFLTATFFTGLAVFGCGLWSHNQDPIVYGVASAFISLVFWLIAAFG